MRDRIPEMLRLVSVLFGVVGRASGWKDCLVSPQDEWKEATEPIPAMRMREEYDRGYTCTTSYDGARWTLKLPEEMHTRPSPRLCS